MRAATYDFFHLNTETTEFYPVCPLPVPAGFPSPADDHREGQLKLSELLIEHPAATVFAWVTGRSMEGVHIIEGDLLIIDRSRIAKDGDIVMAYVDQEWTVKFLEKRGKKVALVAASEYYEPIYPREESEWTLLGVVTAVVHDFSGRFAYYRKGHVWDY